MNWTLFALSQTKPTLRTIATAIVVAFVLAFIGVAMCSEPDDTCIKVGGVVLGGKCK